MNSESDDKAFDEYLDRKSVVSQQYRDLPPDNVPTHLDQQILARAREALSASTPVIDDLARVRARRRRLMQWGVPSAIAASALLVVSIVIRSGTQHEITSADMARAVSQQPMPATAPEADKSEITAEKIAPEESVAAAPSRDAAPGFSSAASPAQERQDVQNSPVYAQPNVNPPAPTVSTMASPPPPPLEKRAEQEAARDELQDQRARMQEAKKSVAPAAAPMANAALRSASGIAESAKAADAALSVVNLHADPERWLEHIRQLRRDGEQVEADQEWQQFVAAYPDHAVAEKDLARGPAK